MAAVVDVPPSTSPPPELPADPSQPTLKKSLGLVALTIYGVGNILGSGIYALVGKAAGQVGNAVWLAFVVAMVAASLTGLSYACLGSRYPRAAGAAFVTQHAFGRPMLAYVVGLAVMMSGLTSMAAASHAFAGYLSAASGGAGAGGGGAGGADAVFYLYLLLFIASLAALNFWGLRESAWVNTVCTIVEVGGLLLIVGVCLRYWGGVDYLDATAPRNPDGGLSAGLLLAGAVLVFFSFVGFEDLLNVSEEVKQPRRTFPIALLLALTIATAIYLAVSISAVSVLSPAELAASKAPLADVMGKATPWPWLDAEAFALIAIFAVTNSALLNYIMGSRIVYGMARQGLLPAVLGRLHASRRTPHASILLLAGIVLALALFADITALGAATALLLLMCFAVVNAALVVLKLRPGEERGGFEPPLIVPIAGAIVCACLVLAKIYDALRGGETRSVVIAGMIVIGAAVLYFIVRPRKQPGDHF